MTGLSIELREIVGDIVSSVADQRCWEDVCDKIADRYGGTAFMLFQYDLETHESPRFTGSRRVRGDAAGLVKIHSEGEAEEDVAAYERLARIPSGVLLPEHKILGLDHDLEMPPSVFRDAVLSATGSKSRNARASTTSGRGWM